MNDTKELFDLKNEFIEYYKIMPIKKYAAYSIGRSQDTIRLWEKDDYDFSYRVKKTKADYLKGKAKNLRPEFIIPLLFRELTPRQEITGKGGKPIPILNAIHTDNSIKQIVETPKED